MDSTRGNQGQGQVTPPPDPIVPTPQLLSPEMVVIMRSLEEINETLKRLLGVSDASIVEKYPPPSREGNP